MADLNRYCYEGLEAERLPGEGNVFEVSECPVDGDVVAMCGICVACSKLLNGR